MHGGQGGAHFRGREHQHLRYLPLFVHEHQFIRHPSFFDASIVVFNDSLQIESSIWDFGDGQVDVTSGPNTVHFYNEPGEYQACVTVNAFNTQTQQECFAMACETLQSAAVGVPEHAEEAPLRAWPMPFGEVLNVDGPAVAPGARLEPCLMHWAEC